MLLRAHSSWAFFLSLGLLLAPDLIYWLWLVDTNPRLWWVAGVAALVYGLIGRIINQGISRDRTHSPWAVALLAVLAVGWGAAQDV
ncbi:hypothetical protein [Szabonella alba]|uniref:hypothetical protein n=1 Tax=Szabonella alba TaxID=2804194 RepID=UPI001F334A6D|nr:hypothetical protein [Szabonella alba]